MATPTVETQLSVIEDDDFAPDSGVSGKRRDEQKRYDTELSYLKNAPPKSHRDFPVTANPDHDEDEPDSDERGIKMAIQHSLKRVGIPNEKVAVVGGNIKSTGVRIVRVTVR